MYTTYSMNQMNDMRKAQYTTTLYSFSSTTQQHQVHLKDSNIQVALNSCSLYQLVASRLKWFFFSPWITCFSSFCFPCAILPSTPEHMNPSLLYLVNPFSLFPLKSHSHLSLFIHLLYGQFEMTKSTRQDAFQPPYQCCYVYCSLLCLPCVPQ